MTNAVRFVEASEDGQWLTVTELATRYGLSCFTLSTYRRYDGFPKDAAKKIGATVYLNVAKVDAWLLSRPRPVRSQPCKWWGALGVSNQEGYARPGKRAAVSQ